MKSVLVISPHPDDETLGCGGTLLRHKAAGDSVNWLIISRMNINNGFSSEKITERAHEIDLVAAQYGFSQVVLGKFDAMALDTYPKKDIVGEISRVIQTIRPNIVYVPHRLDAHSDHTAVFDASLSATKSFRNPFITSIRAYETLSETEFGLRPEDPGFRPNLFVDISQFLERKIEIMRLYLGELAEHPFPRSEKSIRALALLRGATSGASAAEAFIVLREIW
ncbi:MAG: PIG-L family deacetylase [Bdellovibrionales bacterium]|nr:PIG-L family deacetylase [Bdellovibrionales bacterium]